MDLKQLLRLKKEGYSNRRTAELLNVSRNTVNEYVRIFTSYNLGYEELLHLTEKIQGVTPRCRALLRSYIIESAWVALRMDPEMQAYYRKHIGRNPKSIIVKIARKLLNRMLSVIKNDQPYKTNYSLNNGKETKKLKMI